MKNMTLSFLRVPRAKELGSDPLEGNNQGLRAENHKGMSVWEETIRREGQGDSGDLL